MNKKHNNFVDAQKKSKQLIDAISSKKYQVKVNINDKIKFVYLNDLTFLDDMMKKLKCKVIEVIQLKGELDE